jgi:hypothetical protein
MAYMNQEMKSKISPVIKAICQRYGIKASLSVRNNMVLVLKITEGKIDFIGNCNRVCGASAWQTRNGFQPQKDYLDVNPYHFRDHFDGVAKQVLIEILEAMNTGNWDESDIQTDYFNVGWYVDVKIGSWQKPYKVL